MRVLRAIKNSVVKDDVRYRRILSGICRGCYLPLNLKYEFTRYLGISEREIHKAVSDFVREGDCCYDLGTAYGYYALALSRSVGVTGKVLAFEADEELISRLPETIAHNATNVRAEVIPMHYFVGKSTILDQKLISIDYVVYNLHHRPPNFIKIDVEGEEYNVLLGAEHTIDEFHPRMIIEVHSLELEKQCQNYLSEKGYTVTLIDQAKNVLWQETRPSEHNRWITAKWKQVE